MDEKKFKRGKIGIMLISLTLTLSLLLSLHLSSSVNVLPRNVSATENISRPDEWKEWEELMEIKNYTNRSLPVITLGGINTLYGEGDDIAIFASITLHGEPIDPESYCNVSIRHWNGTHLIYDLNSTNMTRIFIGWYYLNWTIPVGADWASYGVLVEADPAGRKTQAAAGFRVGFTINVSVTVDTSDIKEQMDCDGVGDSPICNYTYNLNNVTAIIMDMLNCANNGNNSDLCNYTQNLENNISDLRTLLLDVNLSLWNKLLIIESTTNTINSYVENISEALDCDTSVNDICTKINELQVIIDEINSTTHKTLGNITWMIPQISNILSNVTDVKSYVLTLINEFNCTASNPSDICYRLELIQNYTGPLTGMLSDINVTIKEINTTTHSILKKVNVINTTTIDIINRLREINTTTQNTFTNITWMIPKINEILINLTELDSYITTLIDEFNCTASNPSDVCYRLQDLATNISLIRVYAESLIDEFNCTASNPSDVCYRLMTIEGYSILIDSKVSEINRTTYSILNLVENINNTVKIIDEALDCNGIGDSPLCSYTENLQSSIDKVQDMLNCSNLGNNSDLCDYAERIENNLSEIRKLLISHNKTIWDKLLDIETVINAIHSNTTAIWDALDCDNSQGDVCNYVRDIYNLTKVINDTTINSLENITYIVSKVDILLMNITTIHDYVENLILEFNCTASNPSDVCYRLELIQNATGAGSLADILKEINTTVHETLNMVNYINEVKWGNFSYTQPIPTVLIIQGKIKRLSSGQYLSVGSIQVNITDAYVPTVIWSHEYDDVIKDGLFNIMLGGTYDLSLIPKRKYRRDISVCDGITFDPSLYTCETFTTYFIA